MVVQEELCGCGGCYEAQGGISLRQRHLGFFTHFITRPLAKEETDDMNWFNCGEKILSFGGNLPHKVWKAHGLDGTGFYAISGLDTHGPYKMSRDAVIACQQFDVLNK